MGSDAGPERGKAGSLKLRAALTALVVLAVAAAVVLGYWLLRSPEITQVKVGDIAPDLRLPFPGSAARLSIHGFRGEPVLLVMFLSGCHICEREIREVEAVHRTYGPQGLTVIGVSVDPNDRTRRAFIRRHQLSFLVLADDNGAAVREAYGSWKFPEAYLLDAEGRVAEVWLGSVKWRSDAVRERIRRLLPERPRRPGSQPPTPPAR
jgi:peroxiredoxin